jgi:signal transduction histidine kinase
MPCRGCSRFSRIVDEGRDKPSGVGLGLLIVKTVAERHGGNITVDSQVGLKHLRAAPALRGQTADAVGV